MDDDKYVSDILAMDLTKRVELAQMIWDSISEFPESIELTAEQKLILEQRLESYDYNPDSGIQWSELKKSILG